MEKKSKVICHKCHKPTNMQCPECLRPICAEHSYHINRRLYCADCFLLERKKGILKSWFAIVAMLAAATVLVLVLR